MIEIGNNIINFQNPMVLLLLLLLPIVYFVSRLRPIAPKEIKFAGAFLLKTIGPTPPLPKNAPIWLRILRVLIALSTIVFFAAPNFASKNALDKEIVNTAFVIDNDIAIINDLPRIKQLIIENIEANQIKSPVVHHILIDAGNGNIIGQGLTNSQLKAEIEKLTPSLQISSRLNIIKTLETLKGKYKVIYFSNGISMKNDNDFFEALKKISTGKIEFRKPVADFAFIKNAIPTQNGINLEFESLNKQKAYFDVFDKKGQIIASFKLEYGRNAIELVNQITRSAKYITIRNQNHAAAIFIINSFNLRPLVATNPITEGEQPLLSDSHFINSAAATIGDIIPIDLDAIDKAPPSAIIYGDVSGFNERETNQILNYVKNGGNFIRFLGPKSISNINDKTLSAPILDEVHQFSNGFAIDELSLNPFPAGSIFFDVKLPKSLEISQSILLKSANSNVKVLASFNDGAPLVTMREEGKGRIYTFHTTAAPIWSNIGLSNLQLEFLTLILKSTNNNSLPISSLVPNTALRAANLVDVYGKFRTELSNVSPIFTPVNENIEINDEHPPGVYEAMGASLVLNLGTKIPQLLSLKPPNDWQIFGEKPQNILFSKYFLIIALTLIILDMVIRLLNGIKWPKFARNILPLFLVIALFGIYTPSIAQNSKIQKDDIKLSYAITNDAQTNEQAKMGLTGLAEILSRRTNVEPNGVIGIDFEKDDLARHAIIYWLIPKSGMMLSDRAQNRLNHFMQNGGILLIDTRGRSMEKKRAQELLRNALMGLNIPRLETVPPNHVLKKSFYLLANFPGFYQDASLWVENSTSANQSANDGVSPIIITDGDFARAWAQRLEYDSFGPINDDFSAELPFRVGINIYLYALTGQYKADQVHIRTLLDRMKPTRGRQ